MSGPEHPLLNGPIMEVYAIANGFLLKVNDDHQRHATLTYAKDELGIAEEIIAAQARHKLDVGEQYEMNFGNGQTTSASIRTPSNKGAK